MERQHVRQLVTIAPGQLEVREAPEPVPSPGEAVIAVEAVGLCGSDLNLFTGEHPYSWFPHVQGHEFGGRVVSLPSGYGGPIGIGQRVAIEPLLMCGECLPCRRGRGNCCLGMRTYGTQIDGALTERIAVKADLLYDAEGLTAELAALVEPMSIGLQALARAAVRPDDTVVVYGAGPIGQAILLACADVGAQVMVIDRLASRLALAMALGAAAVADTTAGSVEEAVLRWTGGDGPTVVFEATGVPAVMEEAVRVVASSGTVAVVGLSRQSVTLPMVDFTRKELTVVGSRNNMGRFGDAVELVRRRRDDVQRLISHRFPLERGPEAFALAHASPQTTEKIIIEVASAT
jgi:L-gulonate 5-dehydrogenase